MKLTGLVLLLAVPMLSVAGQPKEYRDPAQVRAFKKISPCPLIVPHKKGTCPGFVVDHIKALACGGTDRPHNMQWQTTTEAKAKDRWELKECKK